MLQRNGARGIAGDHRYAGTEALYEPSEEGRDPARDLGFAAFAIGKAGAVGRVDDWRIGQERARWCEHRQTANAGVEEQDRSRWVHAGLCGVACGELQVAPAFRFATNRSMSRETLVALAIGYLMGSIPFGLLLTRIAGKGDIRDIGSGNIGATNVLRTGSKILAVLTMVLDCLKATAAILIAQRFIAPEAGPAAAAGALVGHLYPVWLKFRGGKGVATFFGVLIVLLPIAAAAYALIWIVVLLTLRFSSVAGMSAAISAPISALMLHSSLASMLFAFAVLVLWKHRQNIVRLKRGTEPRIGNALA